jgi:PAS domain S-box-containing protein
MTSEKIDILYVDDEPGLLDLSKLFLEKNAGFTVHTLSSSQEALEFLTSHPVDAIVCDFQMPKMNGIEFLKVLRGRGDRTPFIIFTGRGREEIVIEALNNGADFYLQKGGHPQAQFTELSYKIRHAVSLRQADKALVESEERYRTVFENTGSATVIIEENTIISLANAEFERLSGFSKEELEGKMSWTGFVVQEDLARMLNLHNLRRTDKNNTLKQYEFRFIRKSGEFRDIFLIIDLIPGTKMSIASLIDITERKRAEEALGKSERKYRNLIDTLLEGVWVIDKDANTTFVNPRMAEMLGYTADEMLGKELFSFIEGPKGGNTRDKFVQMHMGIREQYESELVKKDGTRINVLIATAPVTDEKENFSGAILAVADISQTKKRQQEYRNLVLLNNEAIFILNWEYYILFANPAAEHILGHPSDALLGMPFGYPVFPGELMEIDIPRSDGTFVIGEIRISDITWEDRPAHMAIIRDITGRRLMEQKIKESEKSFRGLFNTIGEGIFVMDVDGRFLEINPGGLDMFGHPRSFLLGQSFDILYAPGTFDIGQTINRLEQAFDHEAQLFEFDGYRSNGETFFAECRLYRGFYFGKDVIIGLVRDITERKRAEEEHARLAAIVKNSNEAIISYNMDGIITSWNTGAEKILGYSAGEAVGRYISMLVPPDLPDETGIILEQIRNGEPVIRYEARCRKKDGGLITLPLTLSPIRDSQHHLIGVSSISHDIKSD